MGAKAWDQGCPTCTKDLAGVNQWTQKQNCGNAGFTEWMIIDDESFADDSFQGKVEECFVFFPINK